jgi:hypothetical protein
MNKNNKLIKMLKKGGIVYLVYKIADSEIHWVKKPDGTYEDFNFVMKMDDPISKRIMSVVAKTYDHGIEYLKKED